MLLLDDILGGNDREEMHGELCVGGERDEKDDRKGITRMLVYNFITKLYGGGLNKIKGQELRMTLRA